MTITDLGLTPGQTAELGNYTPEYIQAWIEATDQQGNAIQSRAGWFLAGLRSGRNPGDPSAKRDASREKATDLAERETRNALHYCPDDADYQDAVFGQHGRLKPWANDQTLRDRMLTLYHAEQPRADQAETERLDRAQRWREAHGIPDPEPRAPIQVPW